MSSTIKPKRLLFVIDNLSTGGAQRQLINLAIGMKARGYFVEIFCYAVGDMLSKPLVDQGIKIHWYIKRSRLSPNVIFSLRNLIIRGKFDLILSFLTTPNVYSLIGSKLLSSHPIPVIISERFCDLPTGISLIEQLSRQLYRFANHLVTNSHHQRLNFISKYPWIKNRISTIYNGYDLSSMNPPDQEPNNHPIRLLTIASISPYKNGICLVEALNILKNEYRLLPHVDWIGQLVMFGDRLEYYKKMEQLIKIYNLEKQWDWLNQRLDIVNQLNQHDVLIHPSFGEGLPNVVCEALACARPVIVSDALDHSHLVQNGLSGYLFDYNNPFDLANKIIQFNNMSIDARRRMGLNGRKYAEANLSLNRFVDEYESLIMSFLI